MRPVLKLVGLAVAGFALVACQPEPTPYQALLAPEVHVARVTVDTEGVSLPPGLQRSLQGRLQQEFSGDPQGAYGLDLEVTVTDYAKGTGKGETALETGGKLFGRVLLSGPKTGLIAARADLEVLRDNVNGVRIQPLPGLPDDVLVDNFARATRATLFGPESTGTLLPE